MTISGEWFVCANLLIDAACLHAAGRMSGRRIRAGRLISASALGTLCAMAAMLCWGYRAAIYAALPVAAMMALIAFGRHGVPRGLTRLMLLALFAAGIARILHDHALHSAAILLALLPAIEFSLHTLQSSRAQTGERAEIRLLFDHGGVSLCGVWDTGNFLRDPVTALPVIVVPYEAIATYLPPQLDLNCFETLPRGFRLLSVHTASGSRLMMCFRPRALFIRRERVWHAFSAVVAISGAMHGDQVLLPPTIEA